MSDRSSPIQSDRAGPILHHKSGSYSSRERPSVPGHRGIDLVDPLEDSALEVLDVLEAHRPQVIRGLRAPSAHLAVDDDVVVRVQFGVAAGNLAEGNQLRTRNPV